MLRFDHVLHAEEDAGQSAVSVHAKHGTMSGAAGEEGGMLAAIDHWKVDHRAHEAGAESPRVLPGIK